VENPSKLNLEKLGRKVTYDDLKDTVKLYPILSDSQRGPPIDLKTFLTLCKDNYDKRLMTDELDVLGNFAPEEKPLVPDGLISSRKKRTQSKEESETSDGGTSGRIINTILPPPIKERNEQPKPTPRKEESESLTSDGETSGGITNTILPPRNRAEEKSVDQQPKPVLRVPVVINEESEAEACECEGVGCFDCNACPQCYGEDDECTACEGQGFFTIPPESGDEAENSREEKNKEYQADVALLHPTKWRVKAQSGNGDVRSELEGLIEYNVNQAIPFPCRHKNCLQTYNRVKNYYYNHQIDFQRKFAYRTDYFELARFLAKRKNARIFLTYCPCLTDWEANVYLSELGYVGWQKPRAQMHIRKIKKVKAEGGVFDFF